MNLASVASHLAEESIPDPAVDDGLTESQRDLASNRAEAAERAIVWVSLHAPDFLCTVHLLVTGC